MNAQETEPTLKRQEMTELLRSRLIECGWRDQIASMCRTVIEKQGVEKVRLADILSEVREEAKRKVPEQIKQEVLVMMRQPG